MEEEVKVVEKTTPKKTTKRKTAPKKPVVKKIALTDEFEVMSLIKNGSLNYKTSEGYKVQWSEYGDVQEFTFKELKHMKASYPKFFTAPWVKIPENVADALKIKGYLKSAIDVNNIDAVFNLSPDEFKEKLIGSPDGIQKLVVDACVSKLQEGTFDSMNKMRILEQVTGIDIKTLADDKNFINSNK